MDTTLKLADWLTQRAAAQAVRYAVFVVEQRVPVELEWDEMDAACLHAVVFDSDGLPVGTGRLLPDGHIGRMAVLQDARGSGIGSKILNALIGAAQTRGDAVVMLNAQTHAKPFYARHGFEREGDEFMEAGIAHICMRRVLTKADEHQPKPD